jgi:hypothetical protein
MSAIAALLAVGVVLLVNGTAIFLAQSQTSGAKQTSDVATMPEISISREGHDTDASPSAEFFDAVKNGRDERTEVPGGYGSYPHIYTVQVGDDVYYGFDTELPEEREPWFAGYKSFDRNTVLDAETLAEVDGDEADFVNRIIDRLADEV